MNKKIKITFLLIITAILTLQTNKVQTYSRYSSTYNETIKLIIEEPNYYIRFNPNTGIGYMPDQEYIYGTSQKLSKNTLTKYGYNFIGWNTLVNGTGTNYSDEQEISNITNINGTIIEIYAQYENIINMRITNLSTNSTNNATSQNETFDFEELKSTISLNSQDSYVIYKVDITNYLDKNMGILSITGLPDNLEYEIVNDYEMKTKLCNANTGNADTESVLLKIKYKDNGYNGTTTYNLDLDFEYREVFNITYENIPNGTDLNNQNLILNNTSNGSTGNYPLNVVNIKYPKEIMVDDTKEFDFYPYIPTTLEVSDTVTYEYTKPTIKLSNVTGNVTINSASMGEWVMFDHPGSVNFDGSYLINTKLKLLSEENYKKDVRITFEIDSRNNDHIDNNTLFNMLNEVGYPWPGYLVRQENSGSFTFIANGGSENGVTKYLGADSMHKVELLKIDDVLYYKINDGYYVWLSDYRNYSNIFDVSATFGGSLYEETNEWRYFNGTLSNMEIRYLDSDIDSKTYLPMYAVYEYVDNYNFYGNQNLLTDIKLFNEENFNKDFEIILNVNGVGQGNDNKNTILNSMYEAGVEQEGKTDFPGFAFRVENNQYVITANMDSTFITYDINQSNPEDNLKTIRFIREDGILYYQINNKPREMVYDFNDGTTIYFDIPVTFGSSLNANDDDGKYDDLYRGFNGSLSNMVILLEK